MTTTRTHKAPWNERAADVLAKLIAAGVSLFRPVQMTVFEDWRETEADLDEHGQWIDRRPFLLTDPNVFALKLTGASLLRLDAWVTREEGQPAACLHVRALGHAIEIWYVPQGMPAQAEVVAA